MQTSIIYWTAAALILTICAGAGCMSSGSIPAVATVASPVQSTASLPAAVVLNSTQHFNNADLEGALITWSDHAYLRLPNPLSSTGEIVRGKQQLRQRFAADFANHVHWDVKIETVRGEIVETKTQYWDDFTRQIGAAPLEARVTYRIENGQIISCIWTLSEESSSKLAAALAAQVHAP